jgi:hypothetical protein
MSMFRSFFLAGFEGSTGYNKHGEWFDQIAATGHDKTVEEDYRELAALGLHAVRETVRWPLVDLGGGRFDLSTVEPFVAAAERHRIEVIWDLFHYGYPRDLDILDESFAWRFAEYCYAMAKFISRRTDGVCWFTPVNEPSFMSFAAGEAGMFAPHLKGRGWELKVALVRAAIAGINAIWDACPSARIVNVDPLCRVCAPHGRGELEPQVRDFNERLVFQSWDMLAGRLLPELGGSPRHLDVVGINYYWTNQWEFGALPNEHGFVPPLADDDPRRLPLSDLVRTVWERYNHPVIISETAEVGQKRGPLIHQLAQDSLRLFGHGVPLGGICLYPILGMPEWHARDVWVPMGLWDPVCHRNPANGRLICEPMLEALLIVQRDDTFAERIRRLRQRQGNPSPHRQRRVAGSAHVISSPLHRGPRR